jgi:hypothetical protein
MAPGRVIYSVLNHIFASNYQANRSILSKSTDGIIGRARPGWAGMAFFDDSAQDFCSPVTPEPTPAGLRKPGHSSLERAADRIEFMKFVRDK